MSPREQLAAAERMQAAASDCFGFLATAKGVLAMADGGTLEDRTHAMHAAELIIGVVQSRLSSLERDLRPVVAGLTADA